MGWIYLGLVIALSTALWPVARWTLARDGDPRVMGFWVSLTAGTVSLAVLLARGGVFLVPALWLAAALFAVAYAIGFTILIMRCLQIGPAGPTVTINNSAMICGVLYGVVWLDPHIPNIWIIGGAIGVLAALVMVGLGRTPAAGQSQIIGRGWLPMVLAGGVFSGLSFITQTYVGLRHPSLDSCLLYAGIGFGLSAVILLFSFTREPLILLRRPRELAGGVVLGLSNAIGLPLTVLAFKHLGSEIVLPVSVTSPMILVLVLGAVVYREHLSRLTWAGCLLAALAVGAIGYGSTCDTHSAKAEQTIRAFETVSVRWREIPGSDSQDRKEHDKWAR